MTAWSPRSIGAYVATQRVVGQPVGDVVGALDEQIPHAGVEFGEAFEVGGVALGHRVHGDLEFEDERGEGPLGAAPHDVGADCAAQLEDRPDDGGVDGAVGAQDELREQVEAGPPAVVGHLGGAAVLDLDEPGLLEALQRLADRLAVDAELLGK